MVTLRTFVNFKDYMEQDTQLCKSRRRQFAEVFDSYLLKVGRTAP